MIKELNNLDRFSDSSLFIRSPWVGKNGRYSTARTSESESLTQAHEYSEITDSPSEKIDS